MATDQTFERMRLYGATYGDVVIQFTRKVRLPRYDFEVGELLQVKERGRLNALRAGDAFAYVGDDIPEGSYEFVEHFEEQKGGEA